MQIILHKQIKAISTHTRTQTHTHAHKQMWHHWSHSVFHSGQQVDEISDFANVSLIPVSLCISIYYFHWVDGCPGSHFLPLFNDTQSLDRVNMSKPPRPASSPAISAASSLSSSINGSNNWQITQTEKTKNWQKNKIPTVKQFSEWYSPHAIFAAAPNPPIIFITRAMAYTRTRRREKENPVCKKRTAAKERTDTAQK